MRVLVCGGRNYSDRKRVFEELDWWKCSGLTIVNGGASGADSLAREWAHDNVRPCITVPANWKMYGKKAGPIRNAEMLMFYRPDMVLAFPGGKGTADMVNKARKAGIEVREIK